MNLNCKKQSKNHLFVIKWHMVLFLEGVDNMTNKNNEMKRQPVKINLVTEITGEQEEKVAQFFEGSVYEDGATLYLRYNEYMDGNEVRTTIKLMADRALIIRRGAINMTLPLVPETTSVGTYETSQGKMRLATKRTMIHRKQVTDRIYQIELHYDLHSEDGQHSMGTFQMRFRIEEEITNEY